MKKFNLFRLLLTLGLFGFSMADDAGAGGEGDGAGETDSASSTPGDNSIGDHDIKDDDIDDGGDKKDSDEITKLKETVKKLQDKEDAREKDNANKTAIANIRNDYPTFDENKIISKLKEIQKTDPNKAAALNNPAGWELLHIKHFQESDVDNDDFDPGRNGDNDFDFDEVMEKAKKGDRKALSSIYDNAISTSSKR